MKKTDKNYILKGKEILITGGTGTWGQELAKQCLAHGAGKVTIFSRNEAAQVAMKQKFSSDRLRFVLGDVREAGSIKEACTAIDIVFHTAALKHVSKCEVQPREALKTNVTGTQNVINACIDNDVDICVNISSDKACDSSCFYGHTKAIAEALITEANNITDHTDFYSVRSGNIFASSGSVITLWKEQIKKNNAISVTSPFMSRFFITKEKAAELTLKTIGLGDRGEIFAFNMFSCSIHDLAIAFIKRYGDKETVFNIIGKFPGEKEEETLFSALEAERTVETKNFFIIYPAININTTDYPNLGGQKKYVDGLSSRHRLGLDSESKRIEEMFDTIE